VAKKWYLPDGTAVDVYQPGAVSSITDLMNPGARDTAERNQSTVPATQPKPSLEPLGASQGIPKLGFSLEAGGSLRNLLLRLYPERIQPALGRGLKVDDLETDFLKQIQDEMNANPQGFLQGLSAKRMPAETRALLDYLKLPGDITDQVVGVQQTQNQLQLLMDKIPELSRYNLDMLDQLLETNPQGFVQLISQGGQTREKTQLLRMIGVDDATIRGMFPSVQNQAKITAALLPGQKPPIPGTGLNEPRGQFNPRTGKFEGPKQGFVELPPQPTLDQITKRQKPISVSEPWKNIKPPQITTPAGNKADYRMTDREWERMTPAREALGTVDACLLARDKPESQGPLEKAVERLGRELGLLVEPAFPGGR